MWMVPYAYTMEKTVDYEHHIALLKDITKAGK